ncbi:hypothetical protein N658DRAFT_501632 [Parathielavia hyrcaniae]|uniref:Uncharacterized protein n=1 Tax=Parathielavia hyrcaniae TaxID=113614 RepID=A0AAN6PR38_9PEZI|nr:hypothetical protein N658DRAFT_501632 [Parathielavia hyrcaniae]
MQFPLDPYRKKSRIKSRKSFFALIIHLVVLGLLLDSGSDGKLYVNVDHVRVRHLVAEDDLVEMERRGRDGSVRRADGRPREAVLVQL